MPRHGVGRYVWIACLSGEGFVAVTHRHKTILITDN